MQEAETTPSAELNRLVAAYMHAHPMLDYEAAVQRVMAVHPDLVRAYAGEVNGKPARVY